MTVYDFLRTADIEAMADFLLECGCCNDFCDGCDKNEEKKDDDITCEEKMKKWLNSSADWAIDDAVCLDGNIFYSSNLDD